MDLKPEAEALPPLCRHDKVRGVDHTNTTVGVLWAQNVEILTYLGNIRKRRGVRGATSHQDVFNNSRKTSENGPSQGPSDTGRRRCKVSTPRPRPSRGLDPPVDTPVTTTAESGTYRPLRRDGDVRKLRY